jgi:hypothetical protein
MACEKCAYTIGHRYYLYPPITCNTCGHIQNVTEVDAEYIDFYANLVHRFRPVQPFYCEKCGIQMAVINCNCRDSGQHLAEQEEDSLVGELFGRVKEKVLVIRHPR